ncbi:MULTISPECIES: enoyl-CoA hydratase/isomerase family protein [Halomonadaceae]|uniref:enoyl-CoA hydratase/isomerase family protein n=1 Tax=Halomonadaceae TaxID=28256 RepID=UPI0015982BBB|nr:MULTISPECIES: enoyl-CoA hydratase-related protein [Halomonas]QJQ96251.1 enoyl-CoA hydratase/isomerase family protein [Halomonas sp. PA5]
MSTCVHYQRHTDIGVISIDNPPVNALGQAVRSGLLEALEQGLNDKTVTVLVLLAEGRTFIAGADIREFGKPPQAPFLPEVISRLEASSKPIIAALHGTALGGGFEVALGCHYRVAMPGTKVGLPEVKLGLLPGAGGTQRLPRLVGMEHALDMITSGRFVATEEAVSLGIIDAIAEQGSPLEAGLSSARRMIKGQLSPRVTGKLPPPMKDIEALDRYSSKLEIEAPELFSPFRCIEAVAASGGSSLTEGLRRERELFLACMDSPQRAGLIHAFFAGRAPHKVPEVGDVPRVTTLALIGDHPLFGRLRDHAERAGITLGSTPDTTTQACLIAQGQDNVANSCDPFDCLSISLHSATDDLTLNEAPAQLALVVDDGAYIELVALNASPTQQQSIANVLKALRQPVVVSRDASILALLHQAADNAPKERSLEAMQIASRSIADQGYCYRTSDIDLLAIEALGYPRHLGGPYRHAERLDSSPSETSS